MSKTMEGMTKDTFPFESLEVDRRDLRNLIQEKQTWKTSSDGDECSKLLRNNKDL